MFVFLSETGHHYEAQASLGWDAPASSPPPPDTGIQECVGSSLFGNSSSAVFRASAAPSPFTSLEALHFQGMRPIAKINWAASVNHLLNVRNGALEGLVLQPKRCIPNAWEFRMMGRQSRCQEKRGRWSLRWIIKCMAPAVANGPGREGFKPA